MLWTYQLPQCIESIPHKIIWHGQPLSYGDMQPHWRNNYPKMKLT